MQMQQPVQQMNGYPVICFALNQQQMMNDAQTLRNAMKGLGTDERAIINVMRNHTWEGRSAIANQFQASFGIDLFQQLRRELSGNLEKVCIGAFMNRYQFWAQQLNKAIAGAGTDEDHLIQLVFTMSDRDQQQVAQFYRAMYNRDMFQAIQSDIHNNDWGRLIKAWLRGQNTVAVDPSLAADQLWQAAKGAGTDEDVFIRILCNTSIPNFQQICACFQQKYGKTLRQIIIREFSGRSEKAYLMAHDFLLNW